MGLLGVERAQALCVQGLRCRNALLLDVSIAADLIGHAGQRHCSGVVVHAEPAGDLFEQLHVVRGGCFAPAPELIVTALRYLLLSTVNGEKCSKI